MSCGRGVGFSRVPQYGVKCIGREFARARALSKFLCENFLPSVVKCKSKAITKCQAIQPASQATRWRNPGNSGSQPDPQPSCACNFFIKRAWFLSPNWNWMFEQPQCLANLTMSPGCLPNSQTNDAWQPCRIHPHTQTEINFEKKS